MRQILLVLVSIESIVNGSL
uniref:Uncharacterized protein n=1 Tax=Arundo donax TaxID=35708 RepID=A0A0A9FVF7_ARUDO